MTRRDFTTWAALMLACLTIGASVDGCTEEQRLASENAKTLLCDPCEAAAYLPVPNCEDVPPDYPCTCIPLEEGPTERPEPPLPEDYQIEQSWSFPNAAKPAALTWEIPPLEWHNDPSVDRFTL